MATENTNPNIVDINLSVTARKPFRIDGDDSRIVYLNTSDMTILERIHETKPKLEALQISASKLSDMSNDEGDAFETAGKMAEELGKIDQDMRELVDFIFDAPVSKVAAPEGSMYDVFEGSFRYEHIILAFLTQYENNIRKEYKKMQDQIKKHTDKYTHR